MLKSSLEDLPPIRMPEGYVLRTFREGDQAGWNTILALAFEVHVGAFDFDRDMKRNPEFHPERVMIVEHAGAVVGTASAWFRPAVGPRYGYIEWVATDPRHRGRKLGYWANLGALYRMRAEGRVGAVLHTDDARLAALRMYLQLGFQPVFDGIRHRQRWRTVLAMLDWPNPRGTIRHRARLPWGARRGLRAAIKAERRRR